MNPSHHTLDRMCLWSNFYCKCKTLLVLFSSSWTALQLSPALVPASFKYGRFWLLDCPQRPWQPAQPCFLSLPYHPSPAAEPEITPLPQHGIFVHKSDMHEQWSSNVMSQYILLLQSGKQKTENNTYCSLNFSSCISLYMNCLFALPLSR